MIPVYIGQANMKKNRIKENSWYPYTVAACAGVALYVVLTHLPQIFGYLHQITTYFGPVILGCVIAYVMNPAAQFFENTLFSKIRNRRIARSVSTLFTLAVLFILLVLLFIMLIPQLLQSIRTLAENLDTYVESVQNLLKELNIENIPFIQDFTNSSNELLQTIGNMLTDNLDKIISTSANIGLALANLGLAFILSIYVLLEKDKLKEYGVRFMNALVGEERTDKMVGFLMKCDDIMGRYITCSLIDSLIIGVSNAVLMKIFGMQYIGLISVVVGLFNLIPTFGPVFGGAVGALILFLVKPYHALIFLIMTIVLQTLDGNVIKPKLFGNSLGVSGLIILISIIVFGNIFGIPGIIVAMPCAAILDYSYTDILLPALERKREEKNREKKMEEEEAGKEEAE